MTSTRFYGAVGYVAQREAVGNPGVWEGVATERNLYGDVLRNSKRMDSSGNVNPDFSIGNSLSVVADAYARDHMYQIQYAIFQGVRWKVDGVEVEGPRLILRLGGVYDGPTPEASEDGIETGTP